MQTPADIDLEDMVGALTTLLSATISALIAQNPLAGNAILLAIESSAAKESNEGRRRVLEIFVAAVQSAHVEPS